MRVHFQTFWEYLVFGAHFQWLLPVCGPRSLCENLCQGRQHIIFGFCFLGSLFCTMFSFNFLKLGITPLMLKIILNILLLFVLNFKINFFYILILYLDSVTDFLKRFIVCYIILIVLIALRQK